MNGYAWQECERETDYAQEYIEHHVYTFICRLFVYKVSEDFSRFYDYRESSTSDGFQIQQKESFSRLFLIEQSYNCKLIKARDFLPFHERVFHNFKCFFFWDCIVMT